MLNCQFDTNYISYLLRRGVSINESVACHCMLPSDDEYVLVY